MILVAPRNNMVIIDPFSGRPVPDDGLMIDETEPFWHRRLCDGDVVRLDAPVEEPQADLKPQPGPTEQEAAPVVAEQETPEPAKPEKKNRRKRED